MERSIDVSAIRTQTKTRWIKSQRRKVSLVDRIDQSVSWWLVIIAATIYLLSAPHTAATFDRLTPGWGWVAPFFVEFGLLYVAFTRKKQRQNNETVTWLVWGLEILLFVTAVIVNGAGAFTAAVTSAHLEDLSFSDMVSGFGTLPATSQVALVLVPIAALIIPIGTSAAGEGLAALVLERKEIKDDLEVQWAEVEAHQLYVAFFEALIAAEVTVGRARKMAHSYAAGITETAEIVDDSEPPTEKLALPKGEAKTRLDALLLSDPASVRYSATQLMELTGAGKTAVYDWKALHGNSNGSKHD